ncbi:unnamed protein product [Mucor circinelloides]
MCTSTRLCTVFAKSDLHQTYSSNGYREPSRLWKNEFRTADNAPLGSTYRDAKTMERNIFKVPGTISKQINRLKRREAQQLGTRPRRVTDPTARLMH